MISIIIPTFNNLKYLDLCINSIKKNSYFNNEILLHINEGTDGSIKFAKEKKIKFSYSPSNDGLCIGCNKVSKFSSFDYILYAHDDFYFCPGWDIAFAEELNKLNNREDLFLSGTMVQPFSSYLEFDCGKTFKDFVEDKFLNGIHKIKYDYFQGNHWQPYLIANKTWDKVLKMSGVERQMKFYATRHTFATNFYKATKDFNLDLSKSILIGILFPVDLFPSFVSQSLLFLSFVTATFLPIIVLKFTKIK